MIAPLILREMQDEYNVGFVKQILSLNLVPRKNVTNCGRNDTSLCDFSEMWYGVFLWAVVSSLVFHLPAALLALATLRRHKIARFFSVGILLMGLIGPLFGGVLTSAAIAGVYKAAGKSMFSLEALVFGVGQSLCVFIISFFRVLATL
ncbi:transmembrane protein 170A isoform X2 [Sinocyclocheilus rhinocerous]|uniref:Transmembrane protein 170A n=1 Tax=Sinocyclocheilus rhinocerous TaxID=307959 RepID=A0A673HD87_9TELE|nr:PREDICTED: transmembrane protein 170A isoform X1 [Sinocyclocheilus rhinocerous]XP_016400732.1 PREDICTED: transmembrane protein 170A isoform X2 [Sinocyclocheilus rhinocerous]